MQALYAPSIYWYRVVRLSNTGTGPVATRALLGIRVNHGGPVEGLRIQSLTLLLKYILKSLRDGGKNIKEPCNDND